MAERVVLNLRLARGRRPSTRAPRRGRRAASPRPTTRRRSARSPARCWAVSRSGRCRTPCWSRSPTAAATRSSRRAVANGVAEAYIDWGIENRTQVAGKASSFFAQQIETLKQEIQDKENQLQAYSRRTDIVSLDPATNVTLKKLEALNQDYISAVSERIGKEARHERAGERAARARRRDPHRSAGLRAARRGAPARARLRLAAERLQARVAGDGRAQVEDRPGPAQPDHHRPRRPRARAPGGARRVPDDAAPRAVAHRRAQPGQGREPAAQLRGGRVQQPAGRDLDPPRAARRAAAPAVGDRRQLAPPGPGRVERAHRRPRAGAGRALPPVAPAQPRRSASAPA